MSAAAHKAEATDAGTGKSKSDNGWYSAFATAADSAKKQPAESPDPAADNPILDTLDALTLSDIPGPHAHSGADDSTLPALVRVQQAEIERLVTDNTQLMDRLETLLEIQGREQVLRQQLQNQVDRIDDRMKLAAPTETAAAVRREARAGVTEEIKPVLVAILDALERFNGNAGPNTLPSQSAQPATPIKDDPFMGGDYGKLPLILTRPLGELMEGAGDSRRSHTGSPNRRPRKALFSNQKPAHSGPSPDRETADGPASSTQTTVISS